MSSEVSVGFGGTEKETPLGIGQLEVMEREGMGWLLNV